MCIIYYTYMSERSNLTMNVLKLTTELELQPELHLVYATIICWVEQCLVPQYWTTI